jgi:hypothetical protein
MMEKVEASSPTYRTWRVAFEALRDVLTQAQSVRDLRRGDDETGRPAWIGHETRVMLNEVNRLRRLFGKGPVVEAHINRAEQGALGHVDYSTKWAIACADLVIE